MTTSRDYRPNFPPHVLSIAENAFLDAVLPVRPGVTTSTDELRNQIAAAIVAADRARAEPPAEAPALPTEPGSVILARVIRGERIHPPMVALHDSDPDDCSPWFTPKWIDGYYSHEPQHITDWIPALVVRDDDHGPVAALRRIVDTVFDPKDTADDCLDAVQAIAREALDRLDNRTQP